MADNKFIYRIKAYGVGLNRRLAQRRTYETTKSVTLIGYGVTLLVSVFFLALPLIQKLPRFALGDVVQSDFKALMDLRIEEKTESERLRKAAFNRERPAFDLDYTVFEKMHQQITTDFTWIARTVAESKDLSLDEKRALLIERMPYLQKNEYSKADLNALLREKKTEVIETRVQLIAEKAFTERAYLREKISSKVLNELLEKGGQIRVINSDKEIPDMVWSAEQVKRNLHERTLAFREENVKDAQLSRGTMRILLTRVEEMQRENPALQYNAQYTQVLREKASEKVTPVYRSMKRGTVFLRAGDVVDKDSLKLIDQVRDNYRKRNGSQVIGILLIMGVLAVSISYFTFRFAWEQMADFASHYILHGLFTLMFLLQLFILWINPLKGYDINFIYFVPFGFFGILVGLLFGARIAISSGVYLAVFSYILTGFDNQSLMLALTTTIAGLYASTRMLRRGQLFKGGLIILISNFILISGFELLSPAVYNYELKVSAILTNSVLSVLLTLGILPLIEFLFNLPTPFRLMELNDFNHPLLVRMAATASSTYSHSVMLSNLSEAAVRALKGDTLLTRVGCLFHDIGKMEHPEFYAENRHLYPNSASFKDMGPLKSAQMIISHVTDGIRIARENRLPEKIIHFIPEHHGTTTIQYFYHKALEDQPRRGARPPIARSDFQYPGPKPQTKETAVVMIGDSVEAASRTAVSATAEEFAQIIDRVIENKIAEEQFHEAPLTLGDLATIRKAFLDVLLSAYHGRPKYPTRQETEALEAGQAKSHSKIAGMAKAEVSVRSGAKKMSVKKGKKPPRGFTPQKTPELID